MFARSDPKPPTNIHFTPDGTIYIDDFEGRVYLAGRDENL